LEDEQKFRFLYGDAKQVGDLSISPDQEILGSGGYGGYLVASDPESGQVEARVRAYPKNRIHKVGLLG